MKTDWMIYGATGYTGLLLVEAALARGLKPILAGRNEEKTRALAERFGLRHRAFSLDDPDVIARAVGDLRLVCLIAGPFPKTAPNVLKACAETGCCYLDLATEPVVFQLAQELGTLAASKGALLVPGAGFSTAVGDCLAMTLSRSVEGSSAFHLAVDFGATRHSRGGIETGIDALATGTLTRENAKIRRVRLGRYQRSFDFGGEQRWAVTLPFPFGELATVPRTVGEIDVFTYVVMGRVSGFFARLLGWFEFAWRHGAVLKLMKILATMGAPDDEERRASVTTKVAAELRAASGRCVTKSLSLGHPYDVTRDVMLNLAALILKGSIQMSGFQTPGTLAGMELLLTEPDRLSKQA